MNKWKKDLEEKISGIDNLLRSTGMVLELAIVGGAAFVLKDLVPRGTTDIDFIKQTNEKAIVLLNNEGFDVNGRVDVYIYQFGLEWEGDLEVIIKTNNLIVKSISTERLMVSRLFSNRRHKDFEEAAKNGNITQDKFEDVFDDVYSVAYSMSTRHFKENVYMIEDLYRLKGWDYENSNIKHLCEQ